MISNIVLISLSIYQRPSTLWTMTLLNRLRWVLSENVLLWFTAYLKGRTQCLQVEDIQSHPKEFKGVPQGSV